jgi:ABC-2 type transport system permease protein
MATDSVARRVAQKEVRLFFASPVAWLFLAAFAAVTLFIFFWVESFFARNIADIRPLFEWLPIVLIFLCAALTMRMWSEERDRGTLEHVLTQPLSLWQFVAGKFWACFTLLLLALASTLPLPVTVALIGDLDWGPVIGGYVATILLGATYLSIGLYVSARTDNPIVSMIGTVALCTLLYMLGSATFTGFFDDRTAEVLRLLGSGARFESITRGIIDLRDLFYYISLCIGFLALNVYALEKQRWARKTPTTRQRHWRALTALLLVNLVLANVWLKPLTTLRVDLTEGRLFSISQPTRNFLAELQEPLLIRAYFSSKTHPLLAPLVPQLRDLLQEYELAGKGKVQVEFVDPATNPELEKEANERYGIVATPFQIADRHQSTLVNAYFNVLVRYGSEHQTLGFSDLIEVRTAPNAPADVLLRNPEYDITDAIRKVLFNYRSGGNLFEGIKEPVEFIGYVSGDGLLPAQLQSYRNAIMPQLELAAKNSQGKFSVRFIEPEARAGAVAAQIEQQWGFKPLAVAPDDSRKYYFYLTLADGQQVVQLPTDNLDPAAFRLALDAGLKRFAPGLTKVVALSVPHVDPQLEKYQLGGPVFTNLERAVKRAYSIRPEDLADGSVAPDADILAVVAPQQLDEASVYAIDQFLMRGGTVVLATSPYTAEIKDGELRVRDWNSGLREWLAHNGLEIGKTLVLDKQNARFPAPILRQSGDYEFRDVQVIDYPYFIDLRPPGLATNHTVTGNLPQVTMAWASPITVKHAHGRRASVLLKSSADSWLSDRRNVMPSLDAGGGSDFTLPGTDEEAAAAPGTVSPTAPKAAPRTASHKLGVIVKGRFDSFFAGRESPPRLAARDAGLIPDSAARVTGLYERSPESARIVLYASNDFMDDRVLNSIVAASGTQYLGPLELFMNTLDWALQDEQLLDIRSRAHFNRTLPPMERKVQLMIEYLNYSFALLWLLLIALVGWLQSMLRRRHFARGLSL